MDNTELRNKILDLATNIALKKIAIGKSYYKANIEAINEAFNMLNINKKEFLRRKDISGVC